MPGSDQDPTPQHRDSTTAVNKLEAGEQLSLLVEHYRMFSGPLPAPATLGAYEKVVHGAGERILAMAERRAKHNQEMEASALASEYKLKIRGQIFGAGVAMAALLAASVAAYRGDSGVGIAAVIGAVSFIVVPLVLRIRHFASERKPQVDGESP